MRAEHSVPAEEARRRALTKIVQLVYEPRGSYLLVFGRERHRACSMRLLAPVPNGRWHRRNVYPPTHPPAGRGREVTARFLGGTADLIVGLLTATIGGGAMPSRGDAACRRGA
jgi:hypothetical protein